MWGIGRHLLGSQTYDSWSGSGGRVHQHWSDTEMRSRKPVSGGILPLLALTLAALAAATPVAGAPAGPPVRIGSTLALTGPLATISMIHKIAGEISVEQINKRNGFLGRPIEWVLLDDQSRPEVTRTLYERLITVDKVDLIVGPHGTGAILSAMAVAQGDYVTDEQNARVLKWRDSR
jgi:ABC-type branched-subunit amino acid transport system substrate-binding protein